MAGVDVAWDALYEGETRRRVALPTYPFERRRYWIERPDQAAAAGASAVVERKHPDMARWFYVPSWKRVAPPVPAEPAERWLVFTDGGGAAAGVVERAVASGAIVATVERGSEWATGRLAVHHRPRAGGPLPPPARRAEAGGRRAHRDRAPVVLRPGVGPRARGRVLHAAVPRPGAERSSVGGRHPGRRRHVRHARRDGRPPGQSGEGDAARTLHGHEPRGGGSHRPRDRRRRRRGGRPPVRRAHGGDRAAGARAAREPSLGR